ncbi:cytidine deaminase-like protein [Scenedesmus sp. NREL 46B-D3]|nr:cytidine deaminase-like protein [Scenedesmus sp. NREL 46B-D3]
MEPFFAKCTCSYLCWDDYFMAVAFLSAERSKDPNKQVGACIVNDENIILSIGYNGFPRGCADSRLPWAKRAESGSILDTKYPYVSAGSLQCAVVVHAEANALLNKNQAHVTGARIYVTLFPCNECAKLLIQAGIREVVYHEAKLEPTGKRPGTMEEAAAEEAAVDALEETEDFVLGSYAELKKANPDTPILVRECSGTEAKLIARFDFGVEKSVSVQGLDASGVSSKLQELVKSGEGLPRSGE